MKRLVFCLLVTLAAVNISFAGNSASNLMLWYREPATNWETEALPLGNGRLGCMVYGGVPQEHVQFNEISLWTGNDSNDTGSYQNFGDIFFDFKQGTAFTDYRRQLDINRAIQNVEYTSDGVTYRREYFSSSPAQVIVMRFTASKPGSYSGLIRITDAHNAKAAVTGNRFTVSGALSNGLMYESQMLVINDGGKMEAKGDQMEVVGANGLTVFLAARTNYIPVYAKNWRGDDPHSKVTAEIDAATKVKYTKLVEDHVKNYQALFNRVELSLGEDSSASSKPTNERMAAYTKGGDDNALESLFFQFGRYCLISCSRPGSLPANLQGLWNQSNDPPWRCDYHSNINVEMNYWPAETTNLSECHIPLLDYIDSMREIRKIRTQEDFGKIRGWMVYTENNIYGRSWWENVTGSAWYCQHFWEHYAFTGDKKYLHTIAYPVMKEICEFWEDRLKALPDGTLVAPDGFSPEQGPREDGVTYDQMIIWDLFGNYVDACKVLKVDAEYSKKIAGMRDRLMKPKIGKWGQLQEWMVDRDDPNNQHRHVSHLFGVYPGKQISPTKTPELAEAAKVSLRARGDSGTGWSKAWKIGFWARLQDGNHAHVMLRSQLKLISTTDVDYSNGGGTYSNFFDAHPPFQIDGNFGATAAIAEMLMQSQTGEINLLPALPDAWQAGYVKGLCARGGFVVNVSWNNGKLSTATVFSRLGGRCALRYGGKALQFATAKGATYRVNGQLALKK